MLNKWFISLSSFVFSDAMYGRFVKGTMTEFAVEFTHNVLANTDPSTRSYVHVEGSIYSITAETIFVARDIWIIDFGLQAYCADSRVTSDLAYQGTFVNGNTMLSVDNGDYEGWIVKRPGIPALIYTWHIDRIICDDKHVKKEIDWLDETNVVQGASYLLECTLLDYPKKCDREFMKIRFGIL